MTPDPAVTPAQDAAAAIEAARDSGIRYFDTAPHYALGLSEQRERTGLDRLDVVYVHAPDAH